VYKKVIHRVAIMADEYYTFKGLDKHCGRDKLIVYKSKVNIYEDTKELRIYS